MIKIQETVRIVLLGSFVLKIVLEESLRSEQLKAEVRFAAVETGWEQVDPGERRLVGVARVKNDAKFSVQGPKQAVSVLPDEKCGGKKDLWCLQYRTRCT